MMQEQAKKLLESGMPPPGAPGVSRPPGGRGVLTGEDLALPGEDVEEVNRRFRGLRAELKPRTELQEYLARRVASQTVRVERSVRNESSVRRSKVRRAVADYDAERLDEANRLYDWITADPPANARKLRETPEGLDRMIRALRGLREDLLHPSWAHWEWFHLEKFENMQGRRMLDLPISRAKALHDALGGDFKLLEAGDGDGLDDPARRKWARERLAELIEAQIREFEDRLQSFDYAELLRDRAEAVDRALVDHSKDAQVARRYEAAAERSLFKALHELERLQEKEDSHPAEKSASISPDDPTDDGLGPVPDPETWPRPRSKSSSGTRNAPAGRHSDRRRSNK